MGILRLAAKNLTRRRSRTALTIMGVAMAIAFTVGILSISEGFMVSFTHSIQQRGEDIVITSKEAGELPLFLGAASLSNFDKDILDRISALDNVRSVFPLYQHTLHIGQAPSPLPLAAPILGVTFDYVPQARPFLKPEQGRLLRPGDGDVLVLGAGIAQAQGFKLGSRVPVRNGELEVVGILAPAGGLEDILSYAPIDSLQRLYGEQGQVNSAAVMVMEPARAEATARLINDAIPQVHAQTLNALLSNIVDLLKMARAIHFSVASVALLMGVLFILSTMLMAVGERVREIGTMRAIGAHRTVIFRIIVTESLVIGLIAGVIGCIGGFVLSRAITYGISQALDVAFFRAMVTPRILAVGMLIAVLIGVLAGLYPAWRTSRVHIVEALHYE